MNAERLKNIAKKSGKLTAEEKKFINELCAELGVKFEPKSTKCSDCYKDAAVQCYNILSRQEPKEGAKYVLKQGVDVIFGSVRVNAATLTDELAEEILRRGFDRDFFEICK